jgi:hypothetical protein
MTQDHEHDWVLQRELSPMTNPRGIRRYRCATCRIYGHRMMKFAGHVMTKRARHPDAHPLDREYIKIPNKQPVELSPIQPYRDVYEPCPDWYQGGEHYGG